MLYQENTTAVRDGDLSTMRDAFRRLVDFPNEGEIHAAGAGPLVVALRTLCEALAGDSATMPASTCDALEATHGSPYASGAAIARERIQGLALRFKRHFDANARRAG